MKAFFHRYRADGAVRDVHRLRGGQGVRRGRRPRRRRTCSVLAAGKGVLMPTREELAALRQVMVDKDHWRRRRRVRRRGASSAPSARCSPSATARPPCMPPRRTTSARSTATTASTPAGWARTRLPSGTTPTLAAEAAAIVQRTVDAMAAEGRVAHRRALRRVYAHGARADAARVQLPDGRPRDAGGAAAARRRDAALRRDARVLRGPPRRAARRVVRTSRRRPW